MMGNATECEECAGQGCGRMSLHDNCHACAGSGIAPLHVTLSTDFVACKQCRELHARPTPATVAVHCYGGPRDDEHAFTDHVCDECHDEYYRGARFTRLPVTDAVRAWDAATDEERRVAWEGP